MFIRIIKNDLVAWNDTAFQGYTKEVSVNYTDYVSNPGKWIFNGSDFELNPNYEQEQEEKEKERIAQLSLTKREVFLALYADKGITPEQIRAELTDVAALIEFDFAERYFRGNALIDLIGQKLGYTSKQLDDLFENGSL